MQYKMKVRDFCSLLEQELIKLPEENRTALSMVTEGKTWTEKGMKLRLDSPNAYEGQQKHIHVMTKKAEFVWNVDGSKSHEGRWSGTPSNKVRMAAARGLGVDANLLENYLDYDLIIETDDDFKLVLEAVQE